MKTTLKRLTMMLLVAALALLLFAMTGCSNVATFAGGTAVETEQEEPEQLEDETLPEEAEQYDEEALIDSEELLATADQQEEDVMEYVLNTNTKKFHYPTCRSVSQMKDKNKQIEETTRDDLIARGYDPCGNCNP